MGGVEFLTRAWSAKSLLKGESAPGFLCFQTPHRSSAKLYITGIREGVTGKERFCVDVAMDTTGTE
jgi:hypothetical protein